MTGCAEAAHVVLNTGTTLAADTSAFADVIAPAGSIIDLQGFGLRANTVVMAAGATLRPHAIAGGVTPVGPPIFAFFNGALYGNGTTQLNGATLDLVMPATKDTGFRPPNGSAFTIVSHVQGTFAGLAEGDTIACRAGHRSIADFTMFANFSRTLSFAVNDDLTPAANLVLTATSSNHAVIADEGLTIGSSSGGSGSGGQRTLTVSPVRGALGTSILRVRVSDGTFVSDAEFTVTVTGPTYFLSEGATGGFFDTDLLLANPNTVAAPVTISFMKDDGSVIDQDGVLPPTSRTTIRVADIDGLAEAAFSTRVVSDSDLSIVVERTMHWDRTGCGSHTEAAVPNPQQTWYFAEGSQGFFSTYILLLNPDDGRINPEALPPVATLTFFREGAAPVQKQFPMPSHSRITVDGAIPELANTSFGAQVFCFPI